LTPAAVDRGWPHQVALRSDLIVRDSHVILTFCERFSLCPRGHTVNDGNDWYKVYCFAEADDAAKFMARFGGVKFDPARRGRGANWARWKKG
jgi:hypothetical protein